MEKKKLGFGLMRLPVKNGDEIDYETLNEMVDCFISKGFTYFDTAWMYMGFKSEDAAKICLTSRYPKDAYTLATKLHSEFISTLEDRDKVFNAQLEKTGVEFFDYYLLHDIGAHHFEKFKELDWEAVPEEERKAKPVIEYRV